MELSKRLLTIAAMVTPGNTLVDVGCDHGYLPIYLLKKGLIRGALACDINKGPLMAAQKNIEHYGLDEMSITTRLSAGLAKVRPGDGQTLVIAGMGGKLIISILSDDPETFHSFEDVILSPQSDIDEVRSFVNRDGYIIADESLVKEDGKYYFIMRIVKADNGTSGDDNRDCPVYTELERKYGPCLIARRDPLLMEYLQKSLSNLESILEHLRSNKDHPDRTRDRIEELEREISGIKSITQSLL